MLAGACAMLGCSADDLDSAAPPPNGVPGVNASIAFEQATALALAPGELAGLTVVTKPPKPYGITLYLIGNALDASLDASSEIADATTGRASFTLRAPNQATTFAVRATITDGPSAELPVAVSDQGFGTIEITPAYLGQRGTDAWLGRIVSGTTCEALSESLPADPPGALPGTANDGEPIVIHDAPVGPSLAIFVRAGHYMWGCSDEAKLRAGETTAVSVPIADTPIDPSEASLDLQLGFAPEPDPWQAILDDGTSLLLTTFFEGYPDTAAMLLGTMQSLAADPQAFEQAATDGDWQGALQAHLQAYSVDLAHSLGALASTALPKQPQLIAGQVHGLPDATGHAMFTLLRIGAVAPAQGGVPSEYLMDLTVDATDTVRLSGSLFWLATAYIGTASEQEALGSGAGYADFTDALSDMAHCPDLTLSGYSGCDTSCLVQLCRDALASRWALALGASATTNTWGEIAIEGSGPATFDDVAALTGFSGNWLGQLSSGSLSTQVTGAVTGEQSEGPPAQ